MEISTAQIISVLNTLPLGYYFDGKTTMEIDEEAETSYYVPATNKIFISPIIIKKAISKITNTDEIETMIRSMLYHELSHAILTPKNLISPDSYYNDIMNIFEDERIETILNNYYMNVNFKKQVFLINDYKGQSPSNPMEDFYYTVRFRNGKYVEDVETIIYNNRNINWCSNNFSANLYFNDVKSLYFKIQKDWNNNEDLKDENKNTHLQINSSFDLDKIIDNVKKEYKDIADDLRLIYNNKLQKLSKELLGYDKNLYIALDNILNGFNKRNCGGGKCSNYNSGVINPRNFLNNNYKYFDRQSPINSANTFGSVHLNLFIDNSGSFKNNQNTIRRMISTLISISNKYKNFTFSLFKCGDDVRPVKNINKVDYECNEGTYITGIVKEIYRKAQKTNTYNYNIVLYDGLCEDLSRNKDAFKTFDNNNCTIISDKSNSQTFKKLQKVKIIYTDNYTKELISNIIKVLNYCFR